MSRVMRSFVWASLALLCAFPAAATAQFAGGVPGFPGGPGGPGMGMAGGAGMAGGGMQNQPPADPSGTYVGISAYNQTQYQEIWEIKVANGKLQIHATLQNASGAMAGKYHGKNAQYQNGMLQFTQEWEKKLSLLTQNGAQYRAQVVAQGVVYQWAQDKKAGQGMLKKQGGQGNVVGNPMQPGTNPMQPGVGDNPFVGSWETTPGPDQLSVHMTVAVVNNQTQVQLKYLRNGAEAGTAVGQNAQVQPGNTRLSFMLQFQGNPVAPFQNGGNNDLQIEGANLRNNWQAGMQNGVQIFTRAKTAPVAPVVKLEGPLAKLVGDWELGSDVETMKVVITIGALDETKPTVQGKLHREDMLFGTFHGDAVALNGPSISFKIVWDQAPVYGWEETANNLLKLQDEDKLLGQLNLGPVVTVVTANRYNGAALPSAKAPAAVDGEEHFGVWESVPGRFEPKKQAEPKPKQPFNQPGMVPGMLPGMQPMPGIPMPGIPMPGIPMPGIPMPGIPGAVQPPMPGTEPAKPAASEPKPGTAESPKSSVKEVWLIIQENGKWTITGKCFQDSKEVGAFRGEDCRVLSNKLYFKQIYSKNPDPLYPSVRQCAVEVNSGELVCTWRAATGGTGHVHLVRPKS